MGRSDNRLDRNPGPLDSLIGGIILLVLLTFFIKGCSL